MCHWTVPCLTFGALTRGQINNVLKKAGILFSALLWWKLKLETIVELADFPRWRLCFFWLPPAHICRWVTWRLLSSASPFPSILTLWRAVFPVYQRLAFCCVIHNATVLRQNLKEGINGFIILCKTDVFGLLCHVLILLKVYMRVCMCLCGVCMYVLQMDE